MRSAYKLIILLALVGAIAFFYFPGLSKYLRLKHQEERLGQDIADLKSRIADLQKEVNLIKTDTLHLEQVLRKEMGLVKPGEVVYKFVEQAPVESDPESSKN